ncbi:YezD family protein [Bacillus massilinigeriensis]|uniref:YezD family protein n=1 Tax=Bacillus massilionigeriensis TaxID=1805475 RepID=UPI00096B4448|nr:YezD family protein [Bacillus massilionigeriensis]
MGKIDQEKWNYILSMIKDIQFGSVLITVHDGEITQVDRTEKNRFQLKRTISGNRK